MDENKFWNQIKEEKIKEFTYNELPENKTEGRVISANKEFLAISWKNGEIIVVDSSKSSKINDNFPKLKGPNSRILDLEFSPFNNNILASAYDDYSLLLFKISQERNSQILTYQKIPYKNHTKKVNLIDFSPVSEGIICSAASLGEILVWDVEKKDSKIELKADNDPTSVSWNPNGFLIGASTKYKNMFIFEHRIKEKVFKIEINEGKISSKFTWVDENKFVTTSWNNKKNSKMLKLWDIRNIENKEEIISMNISNNNIVVDPYIDKDNNLLYTIEKGGNSINIYNYNEGNFKRIKSTSLSKNFDCSILFDKKCLDYFKFEIDRFALYNNENICYVSFFKPNVEEFICPPYENNESLLLNEKSILGGNPESIQKISDSNDKEFNNKSIYFIKKRTEEFVIKGNNNTKKIIEKLHIKKDKSNEEKMKLIEDLKKEINEKDQIIKKNSESINNIKRESIQYKNKIEELNIKLNELEKKYEKKLDSKLEEIRQSIKNKIEKEIKKYKEKYKKKEENMKIKFDELSKIIKNLENRNDYINNNNNDSNNNNIIADNKGDFQSLIIDNIQNISKNKDYSYECTNISKLFTIINKGTNIAKIEIILKNNGNKTWPKNKTLLVFCRESEFSSDEIILLPQKPGEINTYNIIITNLQNINVGEYKNFLLFCIEDKSYGEIITFTIKIKDNELEN